MAKNTQINMFFDMLQQQGLKLTYDDVNLNTAYSDITLSGVSLDTRFSRNVSLKMPLVSSAMDTVTEEEMAIALSSHGGLGIIHRNLDPKEQARRIRMVKLFRNGKINSPVTVQQKETMDSLTQVLKKMGSRFHTFPVTNSSGKFVGLITKNSFAFGQPSELVKNVMTPNDSDFVFGSPDTDIDGAYRMMKKHRISTLPLLDAAGKIVGMYVLSDVMRIRQQDQLPHNTDGSGQLIAAAAVGTLDGAFERASLLAPVGCDLFVIDTAHGASKNVITTAQKLKKDYPSIDVVAGNVSNAACAQRLADSGIDGILVGQGPGRICTTRTQTGIGVPQLSAIYDCYKAISDGNYDIPVCGDGGISQPGDVAKALAVGAKSVILGGVFAGTDETPGDIQYHRGVAYKVYRGMGSHEAMKSNPESRVRYNQENVAEHKLAAEGVSGLEPLKGSVGNTIEAYCGALRSAFGYLGANNLSEFQSNASLFRVTQAGTSEAKPSVAGITTNLNSI